MTDALQCDRLSGISVNILRYHISEFVFEHNALDPTGILQHKGKGTYSNSIHSENKGFELQIMISHIKYYFIFLASRLSMKIVKNLSRFCFGFSWIALFSLVLLKQTPVIHALEDLKTFSSNIGTEQEPPLLLEKLLERPTMISISTQEREHMSHQAI